jgi:hypothetical protein
MSGCPFSLIGGLLSSELLDSGAILVWWWLGLAYSAQSPHIPKSPQITRHNPLDQGVLGIFKQRRHKADNERRGDDLSAKSGPVMLWVVSSEPGLDIPSVQ